MNKSNCGIPELNSLRQLAYTEKPCDIKITIVVPASGIINLALKKRY
jgi:hypothetical protein